MTKAGNADSSSRFEDIPCPLCGSHSYGNFIEVRDRLVNPDVRTDIKPREKDFRIVTCSSCGFLYLNPRPAPDELPRYYDTQNYDPHRESGGGFLGSLFRFVRRFTIRWKAVKAAGGRKGGMLLDVGCGTGEFMAYMQKCGWTATGIEYQSGAAEKARSWGCEVIIGDPADVLTKEDQYDLITLWHSLEHLPALNEAVENLVRALKPGGSIALAVPNPVSLDAKFYKERWVAWDAPRHLYHFRKSDLQALFQPKGFSLRTAYPMPFDPFYHALLSELCWTSGLKRTILAFRGLLVGTASFILGGRIESASSVLYIFEES